jgi:hypothetical protein
VVLTGPRGRRRGGKAGRSNGPSGHQAEGNDLLLFFSFFFSLFACFQKISQIKFSNPK